MTKSFLVGTIRRWLADRCWYQWYFQTERGRAGLAANRARCAGCFNAPHYRKVL